MSIKPIPRAILAALLLLPHGAEGAVSVFIEYHLGESGSLGADNRPQDSSGSGRNMVTEINGGVASAVSGGAYAGSTHSLSTTGTGDEGWYGPNLATLSLPTDNFAFGIWAQAGSAANNQGDVLTAGGGTGAYKLALDSSGWSASAQDVAWIGPSTGVVGSFVADTWTHLMLVRQSGTTTFYVDGVSQGTYLTAPVLGDIHLSVAPASATYFHGILDEARFVTFSESDSLSDIQSMVQYGVVPEPSILGTLTFAGLGLLVRRRR